MRGRLTACLLLVFFIASCQSVEKPFEISKKSQFRIVEASDDYPPVDYLVMPESWRLEVPFVMQAPYANWDIHNDSCEEAGILLAHYYYLGQDLSKENANQEILAMIDYQVKQNGSQVDIFGEEMAKLAQEIYGYHPRVIDGSWEVIKSELMAGNPVIIMTTAAYLKPEKNDYPEMGYHILVATGYDQTGLIVHDPGTYSGENTHYSYAIMESAMRDYGRKVVVLK